MYGLYGSGGLNAINAPGTNFFDQQTNAQNRQKLNQSNYQTQMAQNKAAQAAASNATSKANQLTVGGSLSTSGSSYQGPKNCTPPAYSGNSYTPPSYANLNTNPPNSTIDGTVRNNLNTGFNSNTSTPVSSTTSSSNSTTTTSTTPSLNTNFGNDNGGLTDVFTKLSDLQERQASRDQVRFNQDLNTQSRVYQDFDNVAAQRTSEINRGARQQGYELSSKLSAQGSQQNIAEAKNQGEVQANTTNTIRNSDMQRALSILPMRK